MQFKKEKKADKPENFLHKKRLTPLPTSYLLTH